MYIRPATLEDVATMSDIHALTWKTAYKGMISDSYLESIPGDKWVPVFTKALENNLYEAAVMCTNEKVTGCVTFGRARFDDSGKNGEIITLYVLPEFWSEGQGYRLMRFALQKLLEKGYERCLVWVLKQNGRAIGFYRKIGFTCDNEEITVNLEGQKLNETRYSIRL